MPTLLKYGITTYLVHTKEELQAMGYEENPHLYLGDASLFCIICKLYCRHIGMSKPGPSVNPFGAAQIEVCTECNKTFEPTLDLTDAMVKILNEGFQS